MAIGASQLHTGRMLLEVESFLQSEFQRGNRVWGRSGGDAVDVLAHEIDRRRVFEARDKKIAFHLHDLLLTKQVR